MKLTLPQTGQVWQDGAGPYLIKSFNEITFNSESLTSQYIFGTTIKKMYDYMIIYKDKKVR